MKFAFVIFIAVFSFSKSFAQSKDVPVFISGKESHKSYRIPAIISLPNGELLAFAEGRVHGAGDFGDINIVMKRSSDKGKTWGIVQYIAEFDTLQCGNPAPVVDVTDPAFPNGRLFLFYNTGNNHEGEVRKGKGYKQVWYKTSTDGGRTWTEPTDITLQVHRPNYPQANTAYNFKEDWRTYANTPGHAMQFQSGTYKGRIYVAANTEISEGRLLFNSRNQKGDIRARIIGISSNGGQTWDTTYFDRNLPDPVCQASILTIGKKNKRNILAFCNAADEKKRDNLTLRISFDDGISWKKSFAIYKNPTQKDAAAYSDIVKVSKKRIGVLYEKDNYSQIVYTTVKWK